MIQLKRSLDPTQGKGKEAQAPEESPGTEPKPQQRPQPQLQQTPQLPQLQSKPEQSSATQLLTLIGFIGEVEAKKG